jgi:dolichyl-phosphate beta-glucosyltransferase
LRVDPPGLSVVVPAFNEASRLADEAERFHRAVVTGAIDASATELIVVDDGSSDATADRAEDLFRDSFPHLHVIRREVNSGKGAAIRDGVAVARAPIVAFIDADMAVDPEQMPLLVTAIDEADVAIGSRSVPGSIVESDNRRRALMGRTFSRYVRSLTGMGIVDTQCGFKAFRTPVAKVLFHCMRTERFAFDVELLYLARRLGFRVREVPVHWRDVAGSAVRPVVDPVSMVWDVLRLRMGRQASPIPALTVSAGSPDAKRRLRADLPTALLEEFGDRFPVLAREADGVVVVALPLADPDVVQGAATRIGQLAPDCGVRDGLMSIDQLVDLLAVRPPIESVSEDLRASYLSEEGSVPTDRLVTGRADEETLSVPGS